MSLLHARAPVAVPAAPVARPELHLSGARLRAALEAAITGCEALGGIERYIAALQLKSQLFRDALREQDPRTVTRDTLVQLASFMPTVRRRVGRALGDDAIESLREATAALLDEAGGTATTDGRLAAFVAAYPNERSYRWVRDFAAEVLHLVEPERYPLMTRWVWDAAANTGVLREIWYAPDTDRITLAVRDDYATFLALREELAVFLTDNGCFRDLPWYVDLLQAQVYAEYLSAQGGTYLRTDFSTPDDPMQYTRRMLGLDGVQPGTGKLRTAAIEGRAFVLDPGHA